MQTLLKIICCICLLGYLGNAQAKSYQASVSAMKNSSYQSEIAAPQVQYPIYFTVNANNGTLLQQDKSGYQIILQNVDGPITTTSRDIEFKKKDHTVDEFINLWRHNFHKPIEANLTGIQINPNTTGHRQLYLNIHLTNPQYLASEALLKFDATIDAKNKQLAKRIEKFSNATLFIDAEEICLSSGKNKGC